MVPDDGAPRQRCPCCPCRGAEKVWLGAIRPSDIIARPLCRRSVAGEGLKGCSARCAHELRRRHRRPEGRSWAGCRAVLRRFLAAALPTPGFLSWRKVWRPTSTQVVQVERRCSRRIVGRNGRLQCEIDIRIILVRRWWADAGVDAGRCRYERRYHRIQFE